MKKKVCILLGIIIISIFALGIITNYADTARVTTGHEPEFCIKTVNEDGSKVTYWGLGYKVIRYVGVSPNEPYESNIGVKMGNWFMKYDLPDGLTSEYEWNNNNEQNEYSFFGKVIESTDSYIIVEPNEDEIIRNSSDKISIGLVEYSDVLYTVGTNVKITYDGTVMESYPAQVKATKIELKSADNFEILFYDKHPEWIEKIYTILDSSETEKYDYTIYGYDGSVNIRIDGKDYSLKEALIENKITMEEIIAKANQDDKTEKIKTEIYQDGGSIEYHYENYTIIKCHTLDGNRDVYIGTKDLKLTDVI